ncbi:uncharacterized protein LOC125229678 [Leguminivora glycinivorella]|uniref:uncharacterized protein LOC125229678 n=1 Tax=Leguminivora glycinivorella TaxID=1035111 RepID=UPI00200F85CC|nr:uncharacterized protein LOC125229678 [Leguminivora glycinivorella]
MLRISWTERRTNVSILEELGIKTRLSTICTQRVLGFFGHLSRTAPDSLEKLTITGRMARKRRSGSMGTRWADRITSVTKTTLQASMHRAQDRVAWRQLVKSIHIRHVPQS